MGLGQLPAQEHLGTLLTDVRVGGMKGLSRSWRFKRRGPVIWSRPLPTQIFHGGEGRLLRLDTAASIRRTRSTRMGTLVPSQSVTLQHVSDPPRKRTSNKQAHCTLEGAAQVQSLGKRLAHPTISAKPVKNIRPATNGCGLSKGGVRKSSAS